MPEQATPTPLNPFTIQGMIRDPRLFFGREAELAAIWGYLRKDANVSIVADRRWGKSSLLWYVKERYAEVTGDSAVRVEYLDMQLVESAGEFFGELAQALGLSREGEATPRDLERALAGRRLLLCLDEFDRAAGNPEDFGDEFFIALRGLAQGANLTLAVATKTPLIDYSAQRQMTSPFYNIFPPAPIPLGPLPEAEARALLAGTAAHAGITLPEAALAAALKLAGGHPWQLQLVGSYLVESGLNWPEAERRFHEAAAATDGHAPAPSRPSTSAAAPDWLSPLAVALVGVASLVGLLSFNTDFAPGGWLTVLLALTSLTLFLVDLTLNVRHWRRR